MSVTFNNNSLDTVNSFYNWSFGDGQVSTSINAFNSYADSGQLTLTPGMWTTLTYLNPTYLADANIYNVADVREIGIEFAIPLATAFTPAIIHVDTVQY